jgi:adenylate cyclase
MGSGRPHAVLVVIDPDGRPREVPVYDHLYVGRECAGIEPVSRFLIDEPGVSRNHLEIRLDASRGHAYVVDTSTNGTRLNGVRIERGLQVPLTPGDRLTVGAVQLEFQSDMVAGPLTSNPSLTAHDVSLGNYVMVVGDIVGFTTISQRASSRAVLEVLDVLFGELRVELSRHRGMLGNLPGDAFFAVWDIDSIADAPELAVRFALASADRVTAIGPELGARLDEAEPLRMGWGVSLGDAALTAITGVLTSIVGDAANLAFRLSGIAGRDGRADVLVTETVCRELGDRFPFGSLEHVEVKGRVGTEPVRSLRVPH